MSFLSSLDWGYVLGGVVIVVCLALLAFPKLLNKFNLGGLFRLPQGQAQPPQQPQQPSSGTSWNIPIPSKVLDWAIGLLLVVAAIMILSTYVDYRIVIAGVLLIVIVVVIAVFLYEKEDVRTLNIFGQTQDGSSASATVQVAVKRRAVGVVAFLQLTIFDISGHEYHQIVEASILQAGNKVIGTIPSDRFLRSAGELQQGIMLELISNPDMLFKVTRLNITKPVLPPAMTEALTQRATAIVGAQNMGIQVHEVIQYLQSRNLPVTERTIADALKELFRAQAEIDRISAAGHSFGGFVEWLLQRFERIAGGGGSS